MRDWRYGGQRALRGKSGEEDILVRCVEQEDHSDDSVCGCVVSGNSEASRADGSEDEEQQHAGCRHYEQQATTETFDSE